MKYKISSMLGKKHSEETKARMSLASKGKPKSEEHRRNLSIALKGRRISKESIEKRVQSRKGYRHSEETKRKIGKANSFTINKLWENPKFAKYMRLIFSKANKERIRSLEELKKKSEAQTGRKGSNWKGGITPLYKDIRTLFEAQEWRKKVFERDNYTCQKCYKQGIRINAHHKEKPFNQLLQQFLQEYSQFSPIEDKEILIRLAMEYKPFWDINNGQTLCEDCHNLTKKERKINV